MAAGSIVVDLLMRTGSFSTDTERAAKSLKKLQRDAEAAGKAIGVGIAAGATVAVAAFDQLVKGAAEFKDIEETTGGTAEGMASIAVAAATAGVSMEEVASASIKLSKGLTGVDDESKAAGAALKALGIPLEDFKKLKPEERIDALTKAFAGFKDGTEKTEVAVALFGKTGAEQLKLFKALEEQGGRTTILTQQQINDADAYADAQAKATAEIRLYAQAAATQFLPALNDLTIAAKEFIGDIIGIDKAGKGLNENNGLKAFADGAVDAFAFVVDAADGVVRVLNIMGKGLGGLAAAAVSIAKGQFKEALAIGRAVEEDIKGILDRATLRERLAVRRAEAADTSNFSNEGRNSSAPTLKFRGAVKPTKAPKEKREKFSFEDPAISNALKALEQTDTAKLAALEKQLSELFNLQRETRGDPAVVEAIRNTREEIEKLKALEYTTAITDPLEATKNQFLRSEKDYEGAAQALKELNDEQARTITTGQAIGYTFAAAFEDAITGAVKFSDAVKQLGKDIVRLLVNRFVTQAIVGAVDANFGSGGSGTVTGGTGLRPRANGGPVSANQSYMVGERGPEMFVPNTAGKIIPNGASGGGGVDVQVINNGQPVSAKANTSRQDGRTLVKLVLDAVGADIASGSGPASDGLRARGFGMGGALPRRA